jgi:site-specific recombinase XerD
MKNTDRIFTDGEMRSLLRSVRRKAKRGTLLDKVDYALVTFAWATGCRASEIASTSLDPKQRNHLDVQTGVVVLTDAKWDSQGIIPIDARSIRVIRQYVREVRPLIRNASVLDRLFITKTVSPYTPNKTTKKLLMLLTRYGFPGKTAHSFRHHFCTDLFRRGAHLHEAKALMRHRDVRSTMVYSHATVDDLRAAVNRRVG